MALAVSLIPRGPRKVPSTLSLSFLKHEERPRLSKALPTPTAGWPGEKQHLADGSESQDPCWGSGLPQGPSSHWLTSLSGVAPLPQTEEGKRKTIGSGRSPAPTFLDTFLSKQTGLSSKFQQALQDVFCFHGMRAPSLLAGKLQVRRSQLTCSKPFSHRRRAQSGCTGC